MKISNNLRVRLLEIISALSPDTVELPKLSSNAIFEKIFCFLSENSSFVNVFSSLDELLPDFLDCFFSNSQALLEKAPKLMDNFQEIVLKLLIVYPFTKNMIFFFYCGFKNYNPFAWMFKFNDLNYVRKELINLIIFWSSASEISSNIWDSSVFLQNLDHLLTIDILKAPSLKLHSLIFQIEDFENKILKSCEESSIKALEQDIEKKLQGITQIKYDIFNRKNAINLSNIDSDLYLQDKKVKEETQLPNFVEISGKSQEISQLKTIILSHSFLQIDGPASCGKSALLKHILNKREHILIYIDSTTDLKSLIGAYVAGERIGEFEFRYGPLTQAINQGLVLILENFQEANEEIIILLIKLIENQGLDLSNQQEFIKCKPGFQIIAVSNFENQHSQTKRDLISNHIRCFQKHSLEFKSIVEIISKIYSGLAENQNILQIFTNVHDVLEKHLPKKSKNLLKWLNLAKRFSYFHKKIYGEQGDFNNGNKLLTEEFRKTLLLETFDVFFNSDLSNFISNPDFFAKIVEAFDLLSSIADFPIFFSHYSPQIGIKVKNAIIGRLGLISRESFKSTHNENEAISLENSSIFTRNNIVYNTYSSKLLEKIAICMVMDEPCLLVGDTGCGKTTMAQHCADIFNKKLWVYNMNPNSDAIDLIGGFKPLDIQVLLKQLLTKFIKRFNTFGNLKNNEKFIDNLRNLLINNNYILLMQCLLESIEPIKAKLNKKYANNQEKLNNLLSKWQKFQKLLENFLLNRDKLESNLAFHYVQGSLITALKNGDWILIDEINLANNEVLQKILPILEGESLLLYEKGDLKTIKRHKDFRILACMNPGKDIGKKELPENIKAKFTEFIIPDIQEKNDLYIFVQTQIGHTYSVEQCEKIVEVFLELKNDLQNHAIDLGTNSRRIHISLRNLSRAIKYILKSCEIYGVERSLYDALFLGFASSLPKSAQNSFQTVLHQKFGISIQQYQNMLKKPFNVLAKTHVSINGFLMKKGPSPTKSAEQCNFLITPTFNKYLQDLLRVISNTDIPILLEGPTSSGKTSMIKYLAEVLGYQCVRINNHEHTDIEEYLGSYQPNNKGKLVFMEGVLLQAMKQGSWLILDELNLARSEILESLNRLLDDNKELFVAELQSFVKPHPDFRIFATQNPSTYGGRKELSKAFRNRFVQIYFDEILEEDLELILQKRCMLPPSYTKKMLLIMKDLKVFRQRSNFILGKEGVITIRDLLKWGARSPGSWEELAMEGYCLLAERLRNSNERSFIQEILEKHCKVKLRPEQYYQNYCQKHMQHALIDSPLFIQMNPSFTRMAALTLKALICREPVLLIGDTGCGKTTLCQLLAHLRKSPFFSINCHKFTESSDFIGSLRPIRSHEESTALLQSLLEKSIETSCSSLKDSLIESNLSLDEKYSILNSYAEKTAISPDILTQIKELLVKQELLFEWQDGPLIEAMQQGGVFLIDEISLAEDSVLERLNSVLEPEKTLLVPEKSEIKQAEIVADKNFVIVATMNPGGDFGKRELSAALRNRFSEIWVESLFSQQNHEDMKNMVYQMIEEILVKRKNLVKEKTLFAREIFEFVQAVNGKLFKRFGFENKGITMRDVLVLIDFMENFSGNCNLKPNCVCREAFYMMILNVIGFLGLEDRERLALYREFNQYLVERFPSNEENENTRLKIVEKSNSFFGISPFYVPINSLEIATSTGNSFFSTSSRKVFENLYNILRDLQINKAILLEGAPGQGKSSLIHYLAEQTGNKLLCITLTEQTDILDLLGSDYPSSNKNNEKDDKNDHNSNNFKGHFQWYDGIILQALKNGHWLLLEELNLASQAVLEGLNAILDHRGSVFIPEINKTFKKHENFRIFATQSPVKLGDGRKGLPSSFLNRFNKIFVEQLEIEDFVEILLEGFSRDNERQFIEEIVRFSSKISGDYVFQLSDFIRFFQFKEKFGVFRAVELSFVIKQADLRKKQEIRTRFREEIMEKMRLEAISSENSPAERLDSPLIYDSKGKTLVFLNKHREILPFFREALALSHPIMLIGGHGCGKKSLLRVFSRVFGKELEEITLSPSTDINELIGSYEQIDPLSSIRLKIQELCNFLRKQLAETEISESFQQKSLVIHAFSSELPKISRNLGKLSHICQEIAKLFANRSEIERKVREIESLMSQYKEKSRENANIFRWVPSKLVTAIQQGKWLLLENLALMNPAVLARLNPLIKQRGIHNKNSGLYIHESHDSQGNPLIITPHPEFRMFLLWNHEQNQGKNGLFNHCTQINVQYSQENQEFFEDSCLIMRHLSQERCGNEKSLEVLKEKSRKFCGNFKGFLRSCEEIGKKEEICLEKEEETNKNLGNEDVVLEKLKENWKEKELEEATFKAKAHVFHHFTEFLRVFPLKNTFFLEKLREIIGKAAFLEGKFAQKVLRILSSFSGNFQRNAYFIEKIEEFNRKLKEISQQQMFFTHQKQLKSLEFLVNKHKSEEISPEKTAKFLAKLDYFRDFLHDSRKLQLLLWKLEGNSRDCKENSSFSLWKALCLCCFQVKTYEKHELQRKILYYLSEEMEAQMLEISSDQGFYDEHTHEVYRKLRVLLRNHADFKEKAFKILAALFFPNENADISKELMLFREFEGEILRFYQANAALYESYSIKVLDEASHKEIIKEIALLSSKEQRVFWVSQTLNCEKYQVFFDLQRKLAHFLEFPVKKSPFLLMKTGGLIAFASFLDFIPGKHKEKGLFLLRIQQEIQGFKVPAIAISRVNEFLKGISLGNFLVLQDFNQQIQDFIKELLQKPRENHNLMAFSSNFLVKTLAKSIGIELNAENPLEEAPKRLISSEIVEKHKEIAQFIREICEINGFRCEKPHVRELFFGFFLFKSFRFSSQSDSLSRILWQECAFHVKQREFFEEIAEELAKFMVFERILKEKRGPDANSSINFAKLRKLQVSLENLAKFAVNRGTKDASSSEIMQRFLDFVEPDLKQMGFFLSFLEDKGLFVRKDGEISIEMSVFHENSVVLKAFVEKAKVWMVHSMEQFFVNFKDLLAPLYLSLILLVQSFEKLAFSQEKAKKARNFQQLYEFFLALEGNDAEVKELAVEKAWEVAQKLREDKRILREKQLKAQGLTVLNDRTSRFIAFSKEFHGKIRDEYTKEAVKQQEIEEMLEVSANFNDFSKDFQFLLAGDATLKEKVRESSEKAAVFEETRMKIEDSELLLHYLVNCFFVKHVKANKNCKKDAFLQLLAAQRPLVYRNLSIYRDFAAELTGFWLNNGEIADFSLENEGNFEETVRFSLQTDNFFEKFSRFPEKKPAENATIYEDLDPIAISSVISPLNSVLSRISEFLRGEVFENNALLQNLALLIDFLMKNALLRTPVSKIVTGVQFIVEKLEEWDLLAPKQYGFSEEKRSLVELLLKWRGKERKCWKLQLLQREISLEREDVEVFCGLLQAIDGNHENSQEFFETIDLFLRKCKAGCFVQRIFMLRLAIEYAKFPPQNLRVLKSVFGFYSQFLEEFSKRKTQVLKSLQHEIKEYEDLAGWKSRNYLILKETCEKFRKKVNRISRKYQEILQQSLDDFLLNSLRNDLLHENPQSLLSFVDEVYKTRENAEEKALFQGRKFKEIAKKDEIFAKALRLLRKNSVILPKHCYYEENPVKTLKNQANEPGFASSSGFVQGLLQQLVDRIRDLQREHVTKLMKFRGLQDLFKNLKEIGLNSSKIGGNSTHSLIYEFDFESLELEETRETRDFSKKYEVFQDFFASFAGKVKETQGVERKSQENHRVLMRFYEESERNYYKILDRIIVFRSRNDFHKDLGLANINRGIGFVLEMFYAIRAHFSIFFAVFKEFKELNACRKLFEQIQGIYQENASFLINKQAFSQQLANLNGISRFFSDLEREIREIQLLFIEKHEFLKKIQEFLLTLQPVKELLSTILCGGELFVSCEDLEKVKEFVEKTVINLQNLQKSLDLLVEDSRIRYLIAKKIDRISKEISGKLFEIFEEISKNLLSEAHSQQTSANIIHEGKYNEFLKHCQVNVQKITRVSAEYKENLENFCFGAETSLKTTFLGNESALLSQYLAILKQIVKEACVLHGIFAKTPVITRQNVENIGISLDFSSLLYKHCESVLFYCLEFLANFSKLGSFVAFLLTNLFYKGFCQPKDEENKDSVKENEEDLEDLVEGTGIGEGKGQENVSKEIEFEEQVLGTQGKDEKSQENEKNDEKIEEEDEGMQMENDFEGENFDENKEKQGEKPEENKEDDEFSQVDEEIDYDLWNKEQGNDDEDEKLSELEEEKEQRKLEELDLQGQEQGNNELRAKQQPKDKENTRNLKEFDQNEEEKDAEFQENEEKEQENAEQEQDFNENEGKQRSLQGKSLSGEKSEKMSLDFEGNQEENEGESMENEENYKENEEELQDPLEKKEEEPLENSFEENKENQRNNEEKDREIEQEEEEESAMELEKNEEIPITSGLNPKENKEKNYGVKDFKGGDQDINEDLNHDENKDAKGVADKPSTNVGKELDKEKNGENSSFSQEFLKAVIEHSREMLEQAQMEKFVKDLNVVSEKEREMKEISNEMNRNSNEQEIEYEAFDQRNAEEKGLVTNLPNVQENQRESFLEEEDEKNKENAENNPMLSKTEKRDFIDESKENKQEKNGDLQENKPIKTEKKNNSGEDGENMEDFEKNKELSRKKETSSEDFARKDAPKNKEEEINLSDYFNSKKTQEERKQEIVELIKEWKLNQGNYEKSMQLWGEIEAEAHIYSIQLCEELKSVLEPNEISSFKGDYKSGKRLNMKKIIPYIASNFKKDKIWLRRSNPSKRKYQILLAIDDSLSMKEKDVGFFALESLTVLSLALTKLEVGEIGIAAIDDGMSLLHNFDSPLTNSQTPYLLSKFSFEFTNTNSSDLALMKFMRESIDLFKEVKKGDVNCQQICFIVSDGRINKKIVRPLVMEAEENQLFYVFVILDKKENYDSIYNIKSTEQVYVDGKLQIKMKNYLEDFPFTNYIVINQIHELSRVLVEILRQYFDRKNF